MIRANKRRKLSLKASSLKDAEIELLGEDALDRLVAGETSLTSLSSSLSPTVPGAVLVTQSSPRPTLPSTAPPFARTSPLACSTQETTQGRIALLPPDVVNRIAAGEVVQKPVSVVKELLENSLDAGATQISVSIELPHSIVISDNGQGIQKSDLPMAAVRHATSKLSSIEDFAILESFGFRGEALCSISMVSKLSICSRTADSQVGYVMHYEDAKPTTVQPKPKARQVGTTVTVESLFYNLPHRRQRQTSSARDDYLKILQVVQNYAIFYAPKGVGISCLQQQRKGQGGTDLNTGSTQVMTLLRKALSQDPPDNSIVQELQRRATREVISTVYGSSLFANLKALDFTWRGDGDETAVCSCSGYVSHPGHVNNKRTILVLFVNQRLVESRPLQRCLEQVYGEFCGMHNNSKPFLYLALQVPPNAVDCNVHPTKREVTLLHFEEICACLARHVRDTLSKVGQSFGRGSGRATANATSADGLNQNSSHKDNDNKRKQPSLETQNDTDDNDTAANDDDSTAVHTSSRLKTTNNRSIGTNAKVAPNKLIRTSRSTQAGALEPFLQSQQSQTFLPPSQSESTPISQSKTTVVSLDDDDETYPSSVAPIQQHEPDCPLLLSSVSAVDLSQPGAFAAVSSQCTCRKPKNAAANQQTSGNNSNDNNPDNVIRLPRQAIVRPRRVSKTPCSYTSIRSLREEVKDACDSTALEQLRNACFVGVASPQRCLLQVGEHLLLLHHYQAARHLFYQLALDRFPGGAVAARLGQPINIREVIAHLLEFEDQIRDNHGERTPLPRCDSVQHHPLKISETNASMADQVAACLLDRADMLQEYFSISIVEEKSGGYEQQDGRILLTALPVLLENFAPCIHGLSLFLLRLATEVVWTEERPCFEGICRELGFFYASLPTDSNELLPHVRHVLFPAISTLLVPPKSLVQDGHLVAATKLSRLYRVFERC